MQRFWLSVRPLTPISYFRVTHRLCSTVLGGGISMKLIATKFVL